MKIANIDREILHIYDLRNLNEIFWKDVTFDKIKSHKKQGFTISLDYAIFSEQLFFGTRINDYFRNKKMTHILIASIDLVWRAITACQQSEYIFW